MRYGTTAGCDAPRLNADTLDTLIPHALVDFYTTGGDLITQAVAEFQQAHHAGHAQRRAELAGVGKELTKTQTAIDRYLTAFETGTMEPDICQPRRAALAERAKQLRTRQAELTADLDTPPEAPSLADLDLIREHIRAVVTHGSPQERKSLYEALIDHIEITDAHTLTPVYRVPTAPDDHETDGSSDPATSGNSAVRALETDGGPPGTRTLNLWIKSPQLCRLS